MQATKKYQIERVGDDFKEKLDDNIIVEYPFEIEVNGKTINQLYATPQDLELLVIGQVFTANCIDVYEDVESMEIIDNKAIVKVKKTGQKREETKEVNLKLDRHKIFDLVKCFENKSDIFKATGGAHSCGLVRDYKIIKFEEDVARSNAVDKLIGYIVKEKLDISDIILITSCRISSTIMQKIKRTGIKTVLSVACPTSVSVEGLRKANVNLLAFARDKRFNVYNQLDSLEIV